MPCDCEGYSTTRPMSLDEQWKAFCRHHRAMEQELEAYREWSSAALKRLRDIHKVVPQLETTMPPPPKRTPEWRGETYRDKDGKWPNDIIEHCDWLSVEDFVQGERAP